MTICKYKMTLLYIMLEVRRRNSLIINFENCFLANLGVDCRLTNHKLIWHIYKWKIKIIRTNLSEESKKKYSSLLKNPEFPYQTPERPTSLFRLQAVFDIHNILLNEVVDSCLFYFHHFIPRTLQFSLKMKL